MLNIGGLLASLLGKRPDELPPVAGHHKPYRQGRNHSELSTALAPRLLPCAPDICLEMSAAQPLSRVRSPRFGCQSLQRPSLYLERQGLDAPLLLRPSSSGRFRPYTIKETPTFPRAPPRFASLWLQDNVSSQGGRTRSDHRGKSANQKHCLFRKPICCVAGNFICPTLVSTRRTTTKSKRLSSKPQNSNDMSSQRP